MQIKNVFVPNKFYSILINFFLGIVEQNFNENVNASVGRFSEQI